MIAVDGKDGATGDIALHTTLAPANDDVAAPQPIGQGFGYGGTLAGATAAPGEDGRAVWYLWTAASNGPAQVELCGLSASTLAVSTAAGPVTTTAGTASCDGGRHVSFTAVAGTAYLLAVGSTDPAADAYSLTVAPRPPTTASPTRRRW